MCCRGASGFVQLALDKRTNEQVAIKFLERGGGASQRVIARELLNHRECALHPNIVQLKVPAAWTRSVLHGCRLAVLPASVAPNRSCPAASSAGTSLLTLEASCRMP